MDGLEGVATVPALETTPQPSAPETVETPEIETPVAEPEAPATAEAPPEPAEEEPLPGEPEPDDSVETDGRALDDRTRKMVAELKKTNPAAAKALADQFFRRLAYQKEFPTVQSARQARATIESLGGEEGIEQMQGDLAQYRTELDQFANGDPTLIKQLYESNPKSTVRMVEHALDTFVENNNTEALRQVLFPHMVKELVQGPLTKNLLGAARFLEEGKGQEAYDLIQAIGNWLTQKKTEADGIASKKAQAPDPREKQFQEREERLKAQEHESETRNLSNLVTQSNNVHLGKVLQPFFKQVGLDGQGRREFEQNLLNKVWEAMKAGEAGKAYVRNARNIRAKGNAEETVKFISARFAEVLPATFRSYRNQMYPSLARAAATTNGKAPAPPLNGKTPAPKAAAPATGQAIQVREAPAFETVDWKKTDDLTWARGYAYLTNGKYVYFH